MKSAWIFSILALVVGSFSTNTAWCADTGQVFAECRDHSIIFLDSATGKREIIACDVVKQPCMGYTVTIAGTDTDTVDCSHAGKTVLVQVTPPAGGATFYCRVQVEDATPPTLICPDTLVNCSLDIHTTHPDSFGIECFDACGIDTLYPILCGGAPGNCIDTVKSIKVLWQAIDSSGNISSCTQWIHYSKPSLADIIAPSNDTIYCDNFDLELASAPTLITEMSLSKDCGLILSYLAVDTIDICGGEKWIVRHWSVLDKCNLETRDSMQMIVLLDSIGPVIECSETDTVYLTLEDTGCFQIYEIPQLNVSASCSEIISTSIQFDGSFYSIGDSIQLDTGTNVITYTVIDECWKMDTCMHSLVLLDTLRPVLNCPASVCGGAANDGLDREELLAMSCSEIMNVYYPNPEVLSISSCCELDMIECFKIDFPEANQPEDTVVLLKYVAIDLCGNVSDTCFQYICIGASRIDPRIGSSSVISTNAQGRIAVIPNPTSFSADLLLPNDFDPAGHMEITVQTIDGALVRRNSRQPIPRDLRIPLSFIGEFPPGILIISVTSGNQRQSLRLIKQ